MRGDAALFEERTGLPLLGCTGALEQARSQGLLELGWKKTQTHAIWPALGCFGGEMIQMRWHNIVRITISSWRKTDSSSRR